MNQEEFNEWINGLLAEQVHESLAKHSQTLKSLIEFSQKNGADSSFILKKIITFCDLSINLAPEAALETKVRHEKFSEISTEFINKMKEIDL